MKILFHSNHPLAASGYGQQTNLFARRFRDAGHDVRISAFWGVEGFMSEWENMLVYPSDHTRLGKHRLPQYVEHFADGDPLDSVLVLTLMDVWTWTDPRWGGYAQLEGLRLASWTPVDHDPVPPKVVEALQFGKSRPIAMSRFGEEQLTFAGFQPLYVPHAVDTNIFKPMPEYRTMFREAMKIPEDAFVIGMVANNQGTGPPRKAFPQVFQAFAEFQRTHDDAFLYLHSEVFGFYDGINLIALADICGIPAERIATTDQFKMHIGVEPDYMTLIYNGLDVLCSPSYGEGFGIPILEAQSCGVPVVVSDWTAMPELCGAGWKVQGDRWYDSAHGSFFMCPAVYEIIDALEAAYTDARAVELKSAAREFALGYDADLVMERDWVPVLAELEQREPSVVLPNGNRAHRRARAKAKVNA